MSLIEPIKLSEYALEAARREESSTNASSVEQQTAALIKQSKIVGTLGYLIAVFFSGLALITILCFFIDHNDRNRYIYAVVFNASICAIVFGVALNRIFQKRGWLCRTEEYGVPLSPTLRGIMDDLRTGRLVTLLRAPDGLMTSGLQQAADGHFYEPGLSPSTFQSKYAPIFLRSNPKDYRSFSMRGQEKLGRPIYVYKPDIDQAAAADELPLVGGRPPVHWLALIPDDLYPDWQAKIQRKWGATLEAEMGKFLSSARTRAKRAKEAGIKFNVKGFVADFAGDPPKTIHKPETLRKIIQFSGAHDFAWIRESAERLVSGSI